jgi:adenosylcobyric acid synthase
MKKALMVVGTSSFAGKTLIVAALCRIFRDADYRVVPFKAQNMSLNSAVTPDGREISRAQALQALAAGVECSSDMNPILLKPKGDGVSQVILNGSPYRDISAKEYYEVFAKEKGIAAVKDAIKRLKDEYDIIVLEGAGSPAEINLYEKDIANFAAAEMADAEVILVADIERGGVFASIYGTIKLLKPKHRKRVKGIIINKFRGDPEILAPAIEEIQGLTDIPVIGVVPYMEGLKLPSEDSQSLNDTMDNRADIVVLRLPKISNFTDFDPLAFDHRVNLRYVSSPELLGNPDAIIVPGTKSTIDDLVWIKEKGLDVIKEFKGRVPIVGVCGGFQIMGRKIVDSGVETGAPSTCEGLGLLEVETTFDEYDKTTRPASGTIMADHGIFKEVKGVEISGYEIHMGKTELLNGAQAVFSINGSGEGAIDSECMTFGTYLHGLFDTPSFREGFIGFVLKNTSKRSSVSNTDIVQTWTACIVQIANNVKKCVDLSWFYEE